MTRRWLPMGLLAAATVAGCGKQAGMDNVMGKVFPKPVEVRVVEVQSEDADVRRNAVLAVGKSKKVHRYPSLVRLLCLVARTDSDAMVRAAAARSLSGVRGEGVVETLAEVLAEDPNAHVRLDAAKAMGGQEGSEVVRALAAALKDDTSLDVRVAAAEVLREFRDGEAARALADRLDDTRLAVAFKAWESLRHMTGQDLPREPEPWEAFLASSDAPFARHGHAPALPKGESQRPHFTKGIGDFFADFFKRDVREAELK